MLKRLPQNTDFLIPETINPKDAINFINSYIQEYSCENLGVDISLMNIIDACYVSTLCSTTHFIKYPQGKIRWKISSELIKDFNQKIELNNTEYILIKQQ